MNYKTILKAPILTEKSNKLAEVQNKYSFKVDYSATKGQVKEAVEGLYGVTVKEVNLTLVRGRNKKSWVKNKKQYRSADYKKAIVELSSKDTLKIYEGGNK